MKFKVLGIIALIGMFIAAPALACEGPECYGSGKFKINADATGYGIDWDKKKINRGIAGGASHGAGTTTSSARGYVRNGDAEGHIQVTGGGLSNTTAYKFKPEDADGNPLGDHGKGVGSVSSAEGVTSGSIDLAANGGGFGVAKGGFSGKAFEGTIDASGLLTGKKWTSEGFSGGVAGQYAIGYIDGCAFVISKGDFTDGYLYKGKKKKGGAGWYVKKNGKNAGKIKWFKKHPENRSEWTFLGRKRVPHVVDTNAEAGAEAGITMYGGSYSESYRFVETVDGIRVEAVGTNVGANTHVESYKDRYANSTPRSYAVSRVNGGWNAAGGAAAMSQLETQNGSANAMAMGGYRASGQLGCNFDGSANGYTFASMVSVDGMNGSVMTAGSGMSVSARTNYDGGDRDPQ